MIYTFNLVFCLLPSANPWCCFSVPPFYASPHTNTHTHPQTHNNSLLLNNLISSLSWWWPSLCIFTLVPLFDVKFPLLSILSAPPLWNKYFCCFHVQFSYPKVQFDVLLYWLNMQDRGEYCRDFMVVYLDTRAQDEHKATLTACFQKKSYQSQSLQKVFNLTLDPKQLNQVHWMVSLFV